MALIRRRIDCAPILIAAVLAATCSRATPTPDYSLDLGVGAARLVSLGASSGAVNLMVGEARILLLTLGLDPMPSETIRFEAIEVDGGLEVEIFGVADCRMGCDGADDWNHASEARLRRDVLVDPRDIADLPFRDLDVQIGIRVGTQAAVDLLAQGCKLGIARMRISVDGRPVLVDAQGGFLASIHPYSTLVSDEVDLRMCEKSPLTIRTIDSSGRAQ